LLDVVGLKVVPACVSPVIRNPSIKTACDGFPELTPSASMEIATWYQVSSFSVLLVNVLLSLEAPTQES
jgi:hypothetical protein